LTLSQSRALELALGASLAAIQGPPGTGKTTVILNAVVHHLIEKYAPVASDHFPNESVLVVTSTNNRAVDNVMDPLCSGALADYPLALRLGNREIMGSAALRTLERMQDWLARQNAPSDSEWSELKRRFSEPYQAMKAERRPRVEAELEQRIHDSLGALYAAVIELRSGWLRKHRTEVAEALKTAIAHCNNTRSLRQLLSARRGAGSWLKRLFPSFGCTLLSLGNAFASDPDAIQRVIVDEAGQCHGAYAVSALLRARAALLIGDVHQLEPVLELGVDDERRIRRTMKLRVSEAVIEPYRMYDESGNSAQSLADRAVPERPTLRDHFRCQPAIVALCEAWCGYGMTAHTKPASLGGVLAELRAPVLFLPVAGEQQRFAGSWRNDAELAELLHWVRRLLAHGVPPGDLALITPYRGQLEAIFRALRAEGMPVERSNEDGAEEQGGLFGREGGLAVGTVHRFQGAERRVVLFSTTITQRKNLGFVNDRVNLLNVAASRAKQHLIVLGHEATLRAGNNTRILVDGQARLAPLAL
jgi:hypothetical protein